MAGTSPAMTEMRSEARAPLAPGFSSSHVPQSFGAADGSALAVLVFSGPTVTTMFGPSP